jgi:putative heme-binding domain-containing protein
MALLLSSGKSWRKNFSRGWLAILAQQKFQRLLLLALISFLASAVLLAGQAKHQATSTPKGASADSLDGQQSFATYCGGCHGLDGKGGERAPDIVTKARVHELSDEQLLQIIQNGVPGSAMPPFRSLGSEKLRLLVAHLRALQGNRAVIALPGNRNRGKELFFGKAKCSRCHMIVGQGGFFASDLSGYSRSRSPELIRDAIIQPNRDLDPRRRTVVATFSDGRTVEGIARNEDNFSLQLLAPDGTLHLLSKSDLKNLIYRSESPMPADYGTRLSAAELDDLVNYLVSVGKEYSDGKSAAEEPDDD